MLVPQSTFCWYVAAHAAPAESSNTDTLHLAVRHPAYSLGCTHLLLSARTWQQPPPTCSLCCLELPSNVAAATTHLQPQLPASWTTLKRGSSHHPPAAPAASKQAGLLSNVAAATTHLQPQLPASWTPLKRGSSHGTHLQPQLPASWTTLKCGSSHHPPAAPAACKLDYYRHTWQSQPPRSVNSALKLGLEQEARSQLATIFSPVIARTQPLQIHCNTAECPTYPAQGGTALASLHACHLCCAVLV
jgi:hypothetical protein